MWGCGFVKDGQSERDSVWLWVCSGGVVCLGLWRWGCGLLQTKKKKRVQREEKKKQKNE